MSRAVQTVGSLAATLVALLFPLACGDNVSRPGVDRSNFTDATGTMDGPAVEHPAQPEAGRKDGVLAPDSRRDTAGPMTTFRFAAWADCRSDGLSQQQKLSPLVKAKNPVLVIFPGDVCSSGPDASCLDTWKASYNGGTINGLYDITFASRGNHDSSGASAWQAYFNFAKVAAAVGATNYTEHTKNLTYSFDYGNSHFVALDNPGGGASTLSTTVATWLDGDLKAAEGRGLTHAFIFSHGPEYYMDGHSDSGFPSAFITVFNKHPIISATFHGHEHLQGYAHISSTRISAMTHAYESFITGGAGAGLYSCSSGRSDWCQSAYGYSIIDVNGKSFTVSMYLGTAATAAKTWTFTKP
jgi:hypothetical protein